MYVRTYVRIRDYLAMNPPCGHAVRSQAYVDMRAPSPSIALEPAQAGRSEDRAHAPSRTALASAATPLGVEPGARLGTSNYEFRVVQGRKCSDREEEHDVVKKSFFAK